MKKTESVPSPGVLESAAAEGNLPGLLNRYLEVCRPPPDADPKKSPGVFPNLAGFCRFLGCGIADADALRKVYPDLYDRLCAVLEDEALNSSLSASVLTAYLKHRLGYGDAPEKPNETDCGQLRLIFDHDIMEDGG